MAQNQVILLDSNHPACGPNGVEIQACRAKWILRPGEVCEVDSPVTARVILQMAGRVNLNVEQYDGRKHRQVVERAAKKAAAAAAAAEKAKA